MLVAEDDAITRMLVKLLLERDGYTVLEAANGRQAVEIAVREHPALVVMDLNMPEMNGYDAIAHLRRVPALVGDAGDGADVGGGAWRRNHGPRARGRRLRPEAVRCRRAVVAGQGGVQAAALVAA